MKRVLKPHASIGGELVVPGDKSIGHRAALFSIISKGPIEVENFPDIDDCHKSLNAAKSCGVSVSRSNNVYTLTPPEKINLPPDSIIDCGNSGTTARLLAGILAGSEVEVTLSGDESLSSRPMKRIIKPLTEMGAELFADDDHLPMRIKGKKLLPFEYHLPVPSAQVKSSILLAGLASNCSVVVREDVLSRDHTEILISELGEGISIRTITPVVEADPDDPRKKRRFMPEKFKKEIRVNSQTKINGGKINIPGDISTAAFFFAAAAISGKTIKITQLGLNPTRTAFLDYLKQIGCTVEITGREVISGESRGTVSVTGGELKARKISGSAIVGLIDEIPIIAVMAAFAKGTTVIRDAAELRVKESDRLEATCENLRRMGIKCGLLDDGLAIESGKEPAGADFSSFGDHRIAMAFSIAALFLTGPSTIDDDSVVAVSCPAFYDLLDKIKI